MYTKKEHLNALIHQMTRDRSSFDPVWKTLGEYFSPRRTRFYVNDVNKGGRRDSRIINTEPVLAARTLRAGMMSGITNASKQWFKLTTADTRLSELGSVERYLDQVTKRMMATFAKSNIYQTFNNMHWDCGVFGTAPISIEEDYDTVLFSRSFPVGSYRLAVSDKGIVDTFSRDLLMSVRQVVHKYGRDPDDPGRIDWSRISGYVKNQWDNSNYLIGIEVSHIVQPNDNPDYAYVDPDRFQFEQCMFETGITNKIGGGPGKYDLRRDEQNTFLEEQGFRFFPILVPRWDRMESDAYGTGCPGMDSLGDNKEIQLMEKRAGEVIDKKVRPPMVGPTSLKTGRASILPGEITWVDSTTGSQKFEPAMNVNQSLTELDERLIRKESRLGRAFYVDMFLRLLNDERNERATATEIIRTDDEILKQIGPVIDNYDIDLLIPFVQNSFELHVRQGLLEPPPKELQGASLKIEFISPLHQAQKASNVASIDRLTDYALKYAAVDPNVMKKLNPNAMIDEFADGLGVNPNCIRTDEEVEAIDAAIQKQVQAQQSAQLLEQGANTAKTLSETNTQQPSALKEILKGGQAA